MARTIFWRALAALALTAFALSSSAQSKAPASPRLYVFNGGVLASETARYRLTDADVEEVPLSVASFLIVHPRGVLLWDAGAVADHERGGDLGFEQRPRATRQARALREARADARLAARVCRLQAVRRDLSRALALSLGPHGGREPVRGLDVARLEGRARSDVLGRPARRRTPRDVLRAQEQQDRADNRRRARRVRRRHRDHQAGAGAHGRPLGALS